MRKVIVQQLVSVDGFASRPDGAIDFFDVVPDMSEIDHENVAIMRSIDVVLLGRKTYDLLVQYWPTAQGEIVSEAVNTTPKVVFSRSLEIAPWGDWPPCSIEANAVEHVRRLKQAGGGSILVWGSLALARELGDAGLVDSYQLRVLPVSVGEGVTTFPTTPGTRRLTLVEAKPYASGIVSLTYDATS